MPDVIIAQVLFENTSGFPEDRTQNTWHFETSAVQASVAIAQSIGAALVEFYNTTPPPEIRAVSFFLSPHINRPMSKIKFYRRSDPIPRAPFHEFTWTLGPTTNPDGFPNEVAVTLSYRAETVAGINPRRTRGRIYLGPHARVSEHFEGDARPILEERRIIAGAASRLSQKADPLWSWIVFSRAQAGIGADATHVVTNGYVDNAFDTQRRRGRAATERTIWT